MADQKQKPKLHVSEKQRSNARVLRCDMTVAELIIRYNARTSVSGDQLPKTNANWSLWGGFHEADRRSGWRPAFRSRKFRARGSARWLWAFAFLRSTISMS